MRSILATGGRSRKHCLQSLSGSDIGLRLQDTALHSVPQCHSYSDGLNTFLASCPRDVHLVETPHNRKSRYDCNTKVTDVQQKPGRLCEQRRHPWSHFQSSFNQYGAFSQRKSYSTAAPATSKSGYDLEAEQDTQRDLDPPNTRDDGKISPTAMTIFLRYENLLAKKMGLQLLLYLATGREPNPRLTMDGLLDRSLIPDTVDQLLEHLATVNQGLYQTQHEATDYLEHAEADTPERRQLDSRISKLTWQCRTGVISISELIYGYTQAVMESKIGPSLHAYRNFAETFSTLDAGALHVIAMIPFFRTRQILTDRSVSHIIQQYGRQKDFSRFEQFLRQLLSPDKHFRTATKWEIVDVHGIRVEVPINRHPRLLDILIRAALQVDQLRKARAWAVLQMEQEVSPARVAALFNNFLTYCSVQADWTYGVPWLQQAIMWATFFAETSPPMLQKILFRMLDLCVACDQLQYYSRILDAAVNAGLSIPAVDDSRPDSFSDRARIIRNDWSARLSEQGITTNALIHPVKAAIAFQADLAKTNRSLQEFVGVTDLSRLRGPILGDKLDKPPTASEQKSDESSQMQESKPWSEPLYVAVPNELLNKRSDVSTSSHERPLSETDSFESLDDWQARFLKLQAAYERLDKTLHEQNSTMSWLQTLIDTPHISPGKDGEQTSQNNLVSELLQAREDTSALKIQNANLEEELDLLRAQRADLQKEIETANENLRSLTQTSEQLRVQLKANKPKTLESVFLEKENFNLRTEMRSLSARFDTVLREKESLQKDVILLQEQYEKLEKQTVDDFESLRHENAELQLKNQTAETQHQKEMKSSQVRQVNLQKIVEHLEARVERLRLELVTLRAKDSPFSDVDEATRSPKGLRSTQAAQQRSKSDPLAKQQTVVRRVGSTAPTSQAGTDKSKSAFFTFWPT